LNGIQDLNESLLKLVDKTLKTDSNSIDNSIIVDLLDKISKNNIIKPNNENPIQFIGENFSISTLNNSEDSKNLAYMNKLPVVDSIECEKIIKK
jgi:ATP adenylyltransferase/5',5'''-P-1,P-4-tetraphosphate phosphorylase II